MPVTSLVYVHDAIDYASVFGRCVELAGGSQGTRNRDDGCMVTTVDDDLLAWTWVEYSVDGSPPPLRTVQEHHAPPCWLEAAFDTSEEHDDALALHKRLVTGLGQWLDARGIRWSWRRDGDSVVHGRHDGLS